MNFKEFKTGPDDNNRRLDKIIRLFAADLQLSEIYKAIRKGLIKVNNKKTKSEYRINNGDIIFIADFLIDKNGTSTENAPHQPAAPLPPSPSPQRPSKMPEIVFENNDILIINKPYNVNVHGDSNSLDKIIEKYYDSKNIKNSLSFRPGPVHRLDKKTTGLLAFSMSLKGAQWFAENIKNHNIQKKYYGLVEGHLLKTEEWRDLISNNNEKSKGTSFYKVSAKKTESKENNKNSENSDNNSGKLAETIVKPVALGKLEGKQFSLVEFHIKTGRKHQIRAQSALHGHPLAGDTAYGGKKLPVGKQDFYLTARELIIPEENPLGLPENLKVMLPNDFINVLKCCGIEKSSV